VCDTIHFGRLFFRPIGQVRCAEMNDTRPPPEDHQAPRRGVLLFVNGELFGRGWVAVHVSVVL
jgi:hypothetical protein